MEILIGIVFSILAFVFFLQKKGLRAVSANGIVADFLQLFAEDRPGQSTAPQMNPSRLSRRDEIAGSSSPILSAAETPYQNLPQDSVLRRHYVTHVRYMIEAVSLARPTESALLRHYNQLIESELDDCLRSDARMQKLLGRFDAYRKAA